jgi:hypothetical protein
MAQTTTPAPRGERSLRAVIDLEGPGDTKTRFRLYQQTDLDGLPEGWVWPGHTRDWGRIQNSDNTQHTGYGRMSKLPGAVARLIAAEGGGWRPVRVEVLTNALHGTSRAGQDLDHQEDLLPALENLAEQAGWTIHHAGIVARLYSNEPAPAVANPEDDPEDDPDDEPAGEPDAATRLEALLGQLADTIYEVLPRTERGPRP